jgi:hypothetical protein
MTIAELDSSNAKKYTDERRSAIREIGNEANSLIIEFITKVKDKPDDKVAQWLNCETVAEYVEIVNRVSKSDLTNGLPKMWQGLYPLLTDYLADNYPFEDKRLTEYFQKYRRFKITDSVDEGFVKEAYDFVLSRTFPFRDVELHTLANDEKTALLIVDGMGAEYYPLLLSMAKRKSINIETAKIVQVKLPSSTLYNKTKWDGKMLPTVHGIDNIVHFGAEKGENKTPQQDIVATFSKFETIANRICSGLNDYGRVIVTSDHGSSRLVVLAYEKGLSKTLDTVKDPSDWRYCEALENTDCPEELESHYCVEKKLTYWVVRGYNRLSQSGGKLSVHGGASLEERLVPLIVFTKDKTFNVLQQIKEQVAVQIEEKDYDI